MKLISLCLLVHAMHTHVLTFQSNKDSTLFLPQRAELLGCPNSQNIYPRSRTRLNMGQTTAASGMKVPLNKEARGALPFKVLILPVSAVQLSFHTFFHFTLWQGQAMDMCGSCCFGVLLESQVLKGHHF